MTNRNRSNRPTTLEIGVYSDGTMRPEDLIPKFLDALEPLHLSQSERAQVRAIRARLNEAGEYGAYVGSEEMDWDLDALFDIGNAHTPDYCYFGAGDGACFGVFPHTYLQQMIEDDGGLTVSDTSEVPAGFVGHVLQVSDHGNATLYHGNGHGKLTELWSIV